MNAKIFGLFEHVFFYLMIVFLIAFLMFGGNYLIYLSIASWFLCMICHTIESRIEGKNYRKIVAGV